MNGKVGGLLVGLLALQASGGDGPFTKGNYCSQLGAAICDRGIACRALTTLDRKTCLDQFQAGCCSDDNSCGDTQPSKQAEDMLKGYLATCTNALRTADCASLEAGTLPAACASVGGLTVAPPAPPPPAPRFDARRHGGRAGRLVEPLMTPAE
jgi:hypothetical protein